MAGAAACCDDPGRVVAGWAASGGEDEGEDAGRLPAAGRLAAAVALPDTGIVAAETGGAGWLQTRGRAAGGRAVVFVAVFVVVVVSVGATVNSNTERPIHPTE